MVTFVLAGVLGSVLAGGEAASEAGQARSSSSAGLGAAATIAAQVSAETPARPSGPYRRLFTAPANVGAAVGQERLVRFGQKRAPDSASDQAEGGPCRLVDPSDHKDIDPGIFVPPRDPQIDFKIRRIVPKGCIDPGIFIPKRQK